MKDLTLIIENVRTFRGRHEIPIRPLTILTGENSSGKTTLLALFATLCDRESYPLWPNFNSAPYSLGNYDTIASCECNGENAAPYFSLGFRKPDEKAQDVTEEVSRYHREQGLVGLKNLKARVAGYEISLEVNGDTQDGLAGRATIRNRKWRTTFRFSGLEAYSASVELSKLVLEEARKLGKAAPAGLVGLSSELLRLTPARVISLAPIRTEPRRVYSQIAEAHKPTGEHLPSFVERLSEQHAASARREYLLRVLRIFGNKSGLFERLTVNRLASKPTGPFELQVELAGLDVNLVDVGYGVSQVLPLLVEASTASSEQYLLVQQPEIHLHPRAQAALGTFFVELAAERHCRFLVETHSDYLIDRVRQEVAAGKIAPEMVAITYLHREGLDTKCHLIELDSIGNLVNPPDSYRSFFLAETWRLLHRDARH